MKNAFLLFVTLLLAVNCGAQKNKPTPQTNKGTMILIESSVGNMKIKLYNETPLHRDNFIKLAETGFYNGILFHRIIKNFMIQTGDPDSKTAQKGKSLGTGGPGYMIPAEFNTSLIHKKGALAAARTGDNVNPKRESSGSQFYIVVGNTPTPEQLEQVEGTITNGRKQQIFYKHFLAPENKALRDKVDSLRNKGDQAGLNAFQQEMEAYVEAEFKKTAPFKYTEEQKKIYTTLGGTPHLDQSYTVFGEVVEGMDVIDKISTVATDPQDRPVDDVKIISMKVIK